MLLFGGSANGFYYDMGFKHIGYNLAQWQDVVDRFYDKYKGIAEWHKQLIREAVNTGKITMPTGRFYPFKPYTGYKGEIKWPETQIKNYPVQGLGADLMVLYRVAFRKRLRPYPDCLLISSVHDSIVVDCPDELVEFVVLQMHLATEEVGHMFEQHFGVAYDLPFSVEVGVGNNMKDLVDTPVN